MNNASEDQQRVEKLRQIKEERRRTIEAQKASIARLEDLAKSKGLDPKALQALGEQQK